MPQCNAKSKQSGDRCKLSAVEGKTKCRFHGGKTPKGQKNASKPGSIYSQYLSAEDLKNFNLAGNALGALDTELQLVRMQLARVMRIKLEREFLGGDHLQTEEESESANDIQIKRKLIQYDDLIIRYTGRIETLEKKRAELVNLQLDAELKRKELEKTEELDAEPESKRVVFEVVDGRKNATTD